MTDSPDSFIVEATGEKLDKIAILLAEAKSNWLGGLLSHRLPFQVREWVASKSTSKKQKAADFIKASGYQVKEFPDHTELWQNDEFIGEFKVEFKDGKVQCYERKAKK